MSYLLFMPKWCIVLVEIHNSPMHRRYCQRLNRMIKGSMNHLRTIIKELENAQLIEINTTKKIKHIQITEKGKRIALGFQNIMSELKA